MKLEMRVVSVAEVPSVGKPTYNFVLAPIADSEVNRAVFGAAPPSAQLIVNNSQELPHGFGQQVTVQIGEGDSPATQQAAPRVPSRNRPQ